MSKIHIIAEAGTNNNGQLSKAKKLALVAKEAGADSIKFQMINTWGLYLPGEYEYGNYDIKEVIKIRQEGEMTDAEYTELNSYCNSIDIPFSASVFDLDGLNLLASFNPPYIKLASGDLNNIKLLRQVAKKGIKTIISTGMSEMKDIEMAYNELKKNGLEDIVIMHCVSVYPSKIEQSNLSYITNLKSKFDCEIGFSDHTQTSHSALAALALGATWFEKHFTEDKTQIGLDHKYAQDPQEMKAYVDDLHAMEYALSSKPESEKITEAERFTRKRARRSFYAATDLPEGHIIKEKDVLVVRPEGELGAEQYDLVIGAALKKEIKKHEPFSKAHITR